MIGSASGYRGRPAGSLWKRAPLWRFSALCFALLTLLCVLYPPSLRTPAELGPPPPISSTSYSAPAAATASTPEPANKPTVDKPSVDKKDEPQTPAAIQRHSAAPLVHTASPNSPQTATLSLATASGRPATPNASGIDPAMLGRTYHSYLLADGFKVPLPPGEWALFANSRIKANKDPDNTGMNYFLGQVENKRLVGAVMITALRSPSTPGTGFVAFEPCGNPELTYTVKEAIEPFGHQACWVVHPIFTVQWQQWADKTAQISSLIRAAAGDMVAKEITYPQEFMAAHFYRSESWGLLEGNYMFSPEKNHITSNVAPTYRDSDWFGANLHRYPEKEAYVDKLKVWGGTFWPRFKDAFDTGK